MSKRDKLRVEKSKVESLGFDSKEHRAKSQGHRVERKKNPSVSQM